MEITINIKGIEGTLQNSRSILPKDGIIHHSSIYARVFDDGCTGWTKSAEYNLTYLRSQQQYANDLLIARGHLFLNEVYDMLGMPTTKAGQVVGWRYDKDNPIGDNYVDFGLNDECCKDFVNGISNTVVLDFNVDGCIL